jgi:hypothetical protein
MNEEEKCIEDFASEIWTNMKDFWDAGEDGCIILKLVLQHFQGWVWTGLVCLWTWSSGRLL